MQVNGQILKSDVSLAVSESITDLYERKNIKNEELPEIAFDLEDFTMESVLASVGIKAEDPVKVVIKGKRIWWKPWRRHADEEYNIPSLGLLMRDVKERNK